MSEAPDSPFFEPPEEDKANLLAMQTILSGQFPALGATPPAPQPVAPAPNSGPAAPSNDDTLPFRPRQRPPMALLCVLHDGDHGGEWLALRADRFTIGRVDGDLRISHDGQISSKHAEIARNRSAAARWQLADLGSTNGTFVRITKVVLQNGAELLFGQTRYRFEDQPQAPASAPPMQVSDGLATAKPGAVQGPWGPAAATTPSLVEVTPAGDGAKISLVRSEYWLGRDHEACAIVPRDDRFVSPKHARFFRGNDNKWRVENNRSKNGVWLRITQPIPIEGTCQFLLGEQRFIMKVLT